MNVSQQSTPSSTPPTNGVQYADPLEQRDPWRALWNFSNHDGLLLVLMTLVGLSLLCALVLPQIPASGIASPVAYAEWQSKARVLPAAAYGLLSGLGLFDVFQTAWFKLLLVILAGIVSLRLFNDVARMRLANMPANVLRDELRLRVTDHAPTLSQLAERLRQYRYRVIASDQLSPNTKVENNAVELQEWVHANRAPLAESLSAIFHIGVLLALLGALLNFLLGWQVLDRAVTLDQAAPLPASRNLAIQPAVGAPTDTLTLALQPAGGQAQLRAGESAMLGDVNVRLRQLTPGLRVSAQQNGSPITVTVSNYDAAGRRDALLSFSINDRERAFVLPSALLMARVVISSEDALGSGRLQVFSLGSGALITDTLLQPRMVISNTALLFTADTGALVDADYRPGMLWLWIGLTLAALGLIGTLVYPVQRLVIRHHGHWTEFYGSGRQVRRTIAELLR